MSKKKQKAQKAADKKYTVAVIKDRLTAELTALTQEMGQSSKKLAKEIEKRSAQLAKKLSKKIKLQAPKPEKAQADTN